ncbi:MAG: exonuclease SbcCD subunit D [Chloroflexi bacterium]|nr:exonuclease SbcCD subunit D [Chloroflexota bacterium]
MRLLHTADWHVGRTMRGRSRTAEFEAVLAELIEIARDQEVEALLVCGDIWDKATPSPESDRLVFEALRECVGHGIQAVLLAGNHDNPRKLEALGLLSELLGVQTQHEVLRPNAGGILTIEGSEHVAHIAAVPFITEGRYVDAAAVMGLQEDWFGAYADGVASILRAICEGFDPNAVNILATHIFVDGSRVARVDGSERLLHIGQTYGINAPQLPTSPQYIALGHVHEPQEILAAPVPTAYSGSLLQLDFGERGQQKVVRIIDAVPGQPVTQTPVPLSKGRPLAELRGSLDEVLAQHEEAGDAYLRVRLDVERPEPGIAERVREALPNAVDVQLEYELPEDEDAVEALSQLSAAELFTRYYQATNGSEPPPELIALFEELLEEVDDVQAAEAVGEPPAEPAVVP